MQVPTYPDRLYESIPRPYYSAFAKYTPYGASRDASSSKILVLFQENPMLDHSMFFFLLSTDRIWTNADTTNCESVRSAACSKPASGLFPVRRPPDLCLLQPWLRT